MEQLDAKIGPMLEQDGAHFSKRRAVGADGLWGAPVPVQERACAASHRSMPLAAPCCWPPRDRWGFLSRAGLHDKSQLCRQIEKYAGERRGTSCTWCVFGCVRSD